MNPSVADLEAAGYATLTPDEQFETHGWTLRATAGFTRRLNSATGVGNPDPSPEARDVVLGWLDSRGIKPTVRITPLIDGEVTMRCTEEWGLEPRDETSVLVVPTTGADVDDIQAVGLADERFTDEMLFLNGRNGTGRSAWQRIASRMGAQGTGLWAPGRAVGVVAVSGAIGFVYSVAVHPSHLRQGLGSAVMRAADFWATQRGARYLAIQVVGGNEPAFELYDSLGFTEAYTYHYLQRGG